MKPERSGKIHAGKMDASEIQAGKIQAGKIVGGSVLEWGPIYDGDLPMSVRYDEIYFMPNSTNTSNLSPRTYDKKFYNEDTKQAVMVPVDAKTNTVTIELEALELLLKVAGYEPSDS